LFPEVLGDKRVSLVVRFRLHGFRVSGRLVMHRGWHRLRLHALALFQALLPISNDLLPRLKAPSDVDQVEVVGAEFNVSPVYGALLDDPDPVVNTFVNHCDGRDE